MVAARHWLLAFLVVPLLALADAEAALAKRFGLPVSVLRRVQEVFNGPLLDYADDGTVSVKTSVELSLREGPCAAWVLERSSSSEDGAGEVSSRLAVTARNDRVVGTLDLHGDEQADCLQFGCDVTTPSGIDGGIVLRRSVVSGGPFAPVDTPQLSWLTLDARCELHAVDPYREYEDARRRERLRVRQVRRDARDAGSAPPLVITHHGAKGQATTLAVSELRLEERAVVLSFPNGEPATLTFEPSSITRSLPDGGVQRFRAVLAD